MKEIFVDINDYNKSFITATESDNNSDVYKIIIIEDGRRFDLTGKIVQMAYAISYTDKGDILNLNVTNPTEGEITLEITNELTRKDGDYTCQLLILGENEYRRHSKYYFNLSIRENLFNKISGEIIESPNIGILQELVKKAEFLNIQLENKNKVAENLNSNLNENISVADPLNSSLGEKIPEATVKKTELEKSITKAKEFIENLDGSQNITQLRLDVTELQNGLKSNQTLGYEGAFVVCENTIESRTKGMIVKGKTVVDGNELMSFGEAEKEGSKYKIIISSRGKNLINENVFEDNIAYYLNGSNLSRRSDKYYKTFSANIEPYKNYYISVNTSSIINVILFKNGIGMNSFSTPKSKLINGDYDEIKISVLKNRFVNIQLEEGTEATLYQKFKEDKRVILINEPLRSINDFKDIIYEDNGKVKLNRILGEYIFTGDENISKLSEENEETCLFIVYSDLILNYRVNESGDLICNNFTSYSSENFKNLEGITSVANRFKIRIKKSKLKTQNVEGFKAWLKDNQTKVVYKLPNPITEVVEGVLDIDLDTYINKTYFSILNNYPGTLKFEVQSNIGSLIKNMAEEINNIWDVINNLIVPVLLETNKNIAMAKIKNNLE